MRRLSVCTSDLILLAVAGAGFVSRLCFACGALLEWMCIKVNEWFSVILFPEVVKI